MPRGGLPQPNHLPLHRTGESRTEVTIEVRSAGDRRQIRSFRISCFLSKAELAKASLIMSVTPPFMFAPARPLRERGRREPASGAAEPA